MICSMVSRGESEDSGSWNTTWMSLRMLRRPALSVFQLRLPSRISPSDAMRPSAAKARVVLPEPDSPITPRVSPGARSKSTDSTAVKRPLLNQPRMPGRRVG
jgi:hypothetical protein